MKPNHEPDELNEVLEAGYAAPPLDAAFSNNLVRRMQAEVLTQSSLPRKRQMRWAVVICGVGVAAAVGGGLACGRCGRDRLPAKSGFGEARGSLSVHCQSAQGTT